MKDPIYLLWTGGWDSSFRLLQLLIIEKTPVQPIYIIDSARKSISLELKTVEKIISKIKKHFKEESKNLLEVKYINKSEAEGSEKTIKYFKEFRKAYHIGDQYFWIANICEKYGFDEIEIGQEKVDQVTSEGTWLQEVLPLLKGKGHDCKVDVKSSPKEHISLFRYYRYPLFEYSKLDMADIARKNNFYFILRYAWFCLYPINDRPCGLCRPCQIAKRSGQLTIHKMNNPVISKSYLFFKKVEKRLFNISPLEAKHEDFE